MRITCGVVWGLALLHGCGGSSTGPSSIAVAEDFEGFDSWPSFALPAVDGGTGHTIDARTVFINRLPPEGATEFPVGTLIVKRMPFDTLAMAKRGGSYNVNGAHGWEWFDLIERPNKPLVIKWRGLGPPLGEEYKKSAGTCNDCHKMAIENDSVWTPGLSLH